MAGDNRKGLVVTRGLSSLPRVPATACPAQGIPQALERRRRGFSEPFLWSFYCTAVFCVVGWFRFLDLYEPVLFHPFRFSVVPGNAL